MDVPLSITLLQNLPLYQCMLSFHALLLLSDEKFHAVRCRPLNFKMKELLTTTLDRLVMKGEEGE
jgi:hypothetical protein